MSIISSILSDSSLGSLSLPFIYIGDYTFDACSSLTSVSFPNATSIGTYAFQNCSNLTSVDIPNATSIGDSAFSSCSNITNTSFPNAINIGNSAFTECYKLTSVDIPNAISIGNKAFYNCYNLTSVSFPKATSIGKDAFYYCTKLTSVSVPNVTSIGASAFYVCSELTNIDTPNLTDIGGFAFTGCNNLTSISFPNVTSIGDYAFQTCSNLAKASFPNATSIGANTFYKCSKLTTIYVGTNTSTVCTLSNTNAFSNCTKLTNIYVPASLVDSYKSATNWSSFADKIVAVPTPIPIGGKIFYDAGDNGATYTFYDSNGSVISDTSISGLQNAVKYKVEGNPTKDRFYAVYPELLNDGNAVYWGFYYNADIKSSGGNLVNTGEAIGTGKTATQAILNYIDTYASSETASSNRPSSDILQASPNGYNLYKNCGTSYNYLWDIVRDTNSNSLGGCNDWFVPSKDELKQTGTSKVISSITGNNYIWSCSAYSSSDKAWSWVSDNEDMVNPNRTNSIFMCLVCRSF